METTIKSKNKFFHGGFNEKSNNTILYADSLIQLHFM